MSQVALVGIASNLEGEERALAHLHVDHNGQTYQWQVFVPVGVENVQEFIDSVSQSVLDDIDTKESEWSSLEPKTRTVQDPISGEQVSIPISKDEIVRPSVPDYYAMRRKEYPSLGDQLDAIWKGTGSPAFQAMVQKIADVKAKYPKPS